MDFDINRKSAVLFDMDGVLYDSMPHHVEAWSRTFADFGMHMEPTQVYMNEGCTGSYTISKVSLEQRGHDATPQEIEEIYAHKAEIFKTMPEVKIMKGALELMANVRDSGCKILIVTGSGQKNLISRVLRDFDGFIVRERMVTAFDVKRGKPFPDPYLKGLELAGVDASQTVVVENAPLGIRAGVAAGIDTIAVNTGPLPDDVLLSEKPCALFHSICELADYWKRNFRKSL